MNILFTYLVAFSGNGGIQKFNRCFIKGLQDVAAAEGYGFVASSAYDTACEGPYLHTENFRHYGGSKVKYMLHTLWTARKYDTIILGHINLAILGVLIKWLSPRTQVGLVAHGIEVWRPLGRWGHIFLQKADFVLSVSRFTKDVLVQRHSVQAGKISIFHNTIDPYYELPTSFEKPQALMERYGIGSGEKVVLTLARLSSTEKFKGYDHVLEALPHLGDKVKYLLCGKYDEQEGARLKAAIEKLGIGDKVVLTGFVKDEELINHYLLADVFIMPSKKEGFGIVFIEAMICGLVVIAGNKDGSVDALCEGKLGLLVDPDSPEEITKAIQNALQINYSAAQKLALQQEAMATFGYQRYLQNLTHILQSIK